MRLFSFFSGFVFLGTAALVERSALAAEVTYDAPAECPSREDAVRRLGSPKADARVAIRRRPASGFTADVELGDGDGHVARHIEGETCAGVIDAVRLVFALDQPSEPTERSEEAESPSLTPVEHVEPSQPRVRPDVRSKVEVGLGFAGEARASGNTVLGGALLYVELAAPGLGASWYRPSARIGYGSWDSNATYKEESRPKTLISGGAIDVCPLAAALVSTRTIDLTLGACGVLHFGRVTAARGHYMTQHGPLEERFESAPWSDAGGLVRGTIQIGRKGHVRGFISFDGGVVQRLNRPSSSSTAMEGLAVPAAGYPVATSMWTAALGAGLLFP